MMEAFLAQVRAQAEARGPGWMQEQLAAFSVGAAAAGPSPRPVRASRSRPPERLSPEPSPSRGSRSGGRMPLVGGTARSPAVRAGGKRSGASTPGNQASGAKRRSRGASAPEDRRVPAGSARSGSSSAGRGPGAAGAKMAATRGRKKMAAGADRRRSNGRREVDEEDDWPQRSSSSRRSVRSEEDGGTRRAVSRRSIGSGGGIVEGEAESGEGSAPSSPGSQVGECEVLSARSRRAAESGDERRAVGGWRPAPSARDAAQRAARSEAWSGPQGVWMADQGQGTPGSRAVQEVGWGVGYSGDGVRAAGNAQSYPLTADSGEGSGGAPGGDPSCVRGVSSVFFPLQGQRSAEAMMLDNVRRALGLAAAGDGLVQGPAAGSGAPTASEAAPVSSGVPVGSGGASGAGAGAHTPPLAAPGGGGAAMTGVKKGVIWIFGHSFIYWAEKRAQLRLGGRSLGLPEELVSVRWLGYRGLQWGAVRSRLRSGFERWGQPNVLIIHAGGNDLGSFPMRNLVKDMKRDVLWLLAEYPDVLLVWSEMVRRERWRNAVSVAALNRARIKINKCMGKFVRLNGGLVVRHGLLEADRNYTGKDGVHLTDLGLDVFNYGLSEVANFGYRVWRGMAP
ncbi:uncharacterized protein [Engystomops pustulosus]|uniref:uncharacterized protein n=1 Tax=Engystomops pustulosus TaxID=76066 RepID=UPI003AFA9253